MLRQKTFILLNYYILTTINDESLILLKTAHFKKVGEFFCKLKISPNSTDVATLVIVDLSLMTSHANGHQSAAKTGP